MGHPQQFDLSHFAIVKISGEDACEFLENQLITHLPDLQAAGWLLSAWCLPNGRILANFILFEHNAEYFAILPAMLKQTIIKRLQMYVLRAKVMIEDVSEQYSLLGLSGKASGLTSHADFMEDAAKQILDQSIILRMPGDTARWMLMVAIENLNGFIDAYLASLDKGDRSDWSLLDIQSGLPWITKTTSEQFLPQMLNLDHTGGLSYKKGCYPGQEIIARIHFRGEVKKRLYLGTGNSDITPGPGDQLESLVDGKLIGDVIDAEANVDGGFQLIAAINTSDSKSIEARLRSETDCLIELQAIAITDAVAD